MKKFKVLRLPKIKFGNTNPYYSSLPSTRITTIMMNGIEYGNTQQSKKNKEKQIEDKKKLMRTFFSPKEKFK